MKKAILKNASENPILLPDLTRLMPGQVLEGVDVSAVGPKLIKAGIVKVLDEMPAADEAPAAPETLTVDVAAQKLFEVPELIPEDGFTAGGAPSVEALNAALGQEFGAGDRDAIWEKVQELRVGSLSS